MVAVVTRDMLEQESKTSVDVPGKCRFVVAKKGRCCRFPALPGLSMCGAHRENAQETLEDERVPCPLDPKHTVFRSRLDRHLRICTSVREASVVAQQPFYKKGVNSGAAVDDDSSASPVQPVSSAPAEVVQSWIDRLAKAFPLAVLRVLGPETDAETLLEWSVVEGAPGSESKHAEKHEVQNLALARLAAKADLSEDGVVVEFGCGRGGLAAAVLTEMPGRRSVLVDREVRRHKFENRQESREARILRLRLDISDFDLGAFLRSPLDLTSLPRATDFERDALAVSSGNGKNGPAERLELLWKSAAELQSSPWPPPRLLACAKHLCGGGTDVALRSLLGTRGGAPGAEEAESPCSTVPLSVCMATCCHHCCDRASFVNVPFLEELELVRAPEDFAQLVSTAGWAVGGAAGTGDLPKRRAGMMAKRILDLGRVAWLRDALGLKDATLAWYIGKGVTPENVAIVTGLGSSTFTSSWQPIQAEPPAQAIAITSRV